MKLRYKSRVTFLGLFDIPCASVWVGSVEMFKPARRIALRGVKSFWRPFCRVDWEVVP